MSPTMDPRPRIFAAFAAVTLTAHAYSSTPDCNTGAPSNSTACARKTSAISHLRRVNPPPRTAKTTKVCKRWREPETNSRSKSYMPFQEDFRANFDVSRSIYNNGQNFAWQDVWRDIEREAASRTLAQLGEVARFQKQLERFQGSEQGSNNPNHNIADLSTNLLDVNLHCPDLQNQDNCKWLTEAVRERDSEAEHGEYLTKADQAHLKDSIHRVFENEVIEEMRHEDAKVTGNCTHPVWARFEKAVDLAGRAPEVQTRGRFRKWVDKWLDGREVWNSKSSMDVMDGDTHTNSKTKQPQVKANRPQVGDYYYANLSDLKLKNNGIKSNAHTEDIQTEAFRHHVFPDEGTEFSYGDFSAYIDLGEKEDLEFLEGLVEAEEKELASDVAADGETSETSEASAFTEAGSERPDLAQNKWHNYNITSVCCSMPDEDNVKDALNPRTPEDHFVGKRQDHYPGPVLDLFRVLFFAPSHRGMKMSDIRECTVQVSHLSEATKSGELPKSTPSTVTSSIPLPQAPLGLLLRLFFSIHRNTWFWHGWQYCNSLYGNLLYTLIMIKDWLGLRKEGASLGFDQPAAPSEIDFVDRHDRHRSDERTPWQSRKQVQAPSPSPHPLLSLKTQLSFLRHSNGLAVFTKVKDLECPFTKDKSGKAEGYYGWTTDPLRAANLAEWERSQCKGWGMKKEFRIGSDGERKDVVTQSGIESNYDSGRTANEIIPNDREVACGTSTLGQHQWGVQFGEVAQIKQETGIKYEQLNGTEEVLGVKSISGSRNETRSEPEVQDQVSSTKMEQSSPVAAPYVYKSRTLRRVARYLEMLKLPRYQPNRVQSAEIGNDNDKVDDSATMPPLDHSPALLPLSLLFPKKAKLRQKEIEERNVSDVALTDPVASTDPFYTQLPETSEWKNREAVASASEILARVVGRYLWKDLGIREGRRSKNLKSGNSQPPPKLPPKRHSDANLPLLAVDAGIYDGGEWTVGIIEEGMLGIGFEPVTRHIAEFQRFMGAWKFGSLYGSGGRGSGSSKSPRKDSDLKTANVASSSTATFLTSRIAPSPFEFTANGTLPAGVTPSCATLGAHRADGGAATVGKWLNCFKEERANPNSDRQTPNFFLDTAAWIEQETAKFKAKISKSTSPSSSEPPHSAPLLDRLLADKPLLDKRNKKSAVSLVARGIDHSQSPQYSSLEEAKEAANTSEAGQEALRRRKSGEIVSQVQENLANVLAFDLYRRRLEENFNGFTGTRISGGVSLERSWPVCGEDEHEGNDEDRDAGIESESSDEDNGTAIYRSRSQKLGFFHLIQGGLGPSETSLKIEDRGDFSSFVSHTFQGRPRFDRSFETVPVLVLDDILENDYLRNPTVGRDQTDTKPIQIEFFKIDVEGFEQQVLQGSERLLAQNRIHYIQFEYQPATLLSAGTDFLRMLYWLSWYGFQCYTEMAFVPGVSGRDWLEEGTENPESNSKAAAAEARTPAEAAATDSDAGEMRNFHSLARKWGLGFDRFTNVWSKNTWELAVPPEAVEILCENVNFKYWDGE